MKNEKLTIQTVENTIKQLWKIEEKLKNRKLFDELYLFVYSIIIDFKNYKNFVKLNKSASTTLKRDYSRRKHMLTLEVDKLAKTKGIW